VTPGPVPTFSVIIACYNAAATVGEAIRSCLDQTVPPLEIIVIDDGSTDAIDAALEPFLGDIVLLRQENGGESVAKNAGVGVARGDFVVILDADDVAYPHRHEALGALAAARPDLAILTHDALLTRDGAVLRHYYGDFHPFPIEHQRREILRRCFVINPAVRRSAWTAVGGYDPAIRIGADWECWLRMILAGERVGCVDEPLSDYRQGGEQLTSNRLREFGGRQQLFAKTLARTDLTIEERASLIDLRTTLDGRMAREAIRTGAPGARRASLRVAFARGQRWPVRTRALAAAIAPDVMARRLPPE
jgi:glycosyltransferase involved in cell wall biosynthesis